VEKKDDTRLPSPKANRSWLQSISWRSSCHVSTRDYAVSNDMRAAPQKNKTKLTSAYFRPTAKASMYARSATGMLWMKTLSLGKAVKVGIAKLLRPGLS
jgi:hypothetical protein